MTDNFKSIVKEEVHIAKDNIVAGYTTDFEIDLVNNINGAKLILVKDSGIDSSLGIKKEHSRELAKKGNLIITEYPGHVIPCFNN